MPDRADSAVFQVCLRPGEQNDKINKACTDVGEDIVRISRKKRACEDFDDAQSSTLATRVDTVVLRAELQKYRKLS